ncbi:MAG: MFS transporter [Phycisphaerae bacterium]
MASWRQRSYEVLPALSVRGDQLRGYLRTITVAWTYGIIWLTIIQGGRMNHFARMLGFSDFHFGLLGAIPFIARFGQLAAAILIEKTGLRKYQFLSCATFHRFVWLVIAAIPAISLIPGIPTLPAAWAVWIMLGLLAVSFLSESLATPAWQMWMGDLIPRRIRGRYFSNRKRFTELIRIPFVIVLAIVVDAVTRHGAMTAENQPVLLWTLSVLFALAGIFGMIDILLFRHMREVVPSTRDEPRRPAVDIRVPRVHGRPFSRLQQGVSYLRVAGDQLLASPMRDPVFRRTALVMAVVTFALPVSGPFFYRYFLESLKFSVLATDMLFLVVGPIVGILAAKHWGRLLDRHGSRPVLILGMFFTSLSVLPYFFAMPHTPTPRFVVDAINAVAGPIGSLMGYHQNLLSYGSPVGAWLVMTLSMTLGAAGWTGVMLAQNNIVLGFSDGAGRSKYVAAYAVIVSLGGMLGGLSGGVVAWLLDYYSHDGHPLRLGYFVFTNWHATFVMSWMARFGGMLLLIRMPDPGAGTFRGMMRHIGSAIAARLRRR